MRPTRLTLLAATALLVAACGGGAASPAASMPPASDSPVVSGAPSAPPSASAAPTVAPSAAATRIEVTLTDRLTIEPATMTVPAGVPVTFVVTNTGVTDHEFFVGDEAAQAEHEVEMAGGGMTHDEEMGIGVDPGETKELTITFPEAGALLAGCHVAGHYGAGMKATISVE